VGGSVVLVLGAYSVAALLVAGVLWLLLEANTRRRLRLSVRAIDNITTRNDWSNWLSDAAGILVGLAVRDNVSATIHQLQRTDADGIWALSEQAEAILERDEKSQEGREILAECGLRITTLCSSQTFFDDDPWRLAIAATVYARCGLRTRACQLVARVRNEDAQRRVMLLRDRHLVGYLYLLRVLSSYQLDTEGLQTVAIVQLESRILRSLDEEGTAALPTVMQNRTATKAAERILQGTAPVHARRIAAWALARGTE
tara:strand:- start:5111 stop:5881 length:771 start_codon:yes stop_codon:yes gene_type:complete